MGFMQMIDTQTPIFRVFTYILAFPAVFGTHGHTFPINDACQSYSRTRVYYRP